MLVVLLAFGWWLGSGDPPRTDPQGAGPALDPAVVVDVPDGLGRDAPAPVPTDRGPAESLGAGTLPGPGSVTGDSSSTAAHGRVVVNLALVPGASAGTPIETDAVPKLADARLVLRRLPDGAGERLRPVDGIATRDGAAPGTYVVELSGRGLARQVRTLEVAAGRTTALAFELTPGLPVTIVLAHDDDFTTRSARVTVVDAGGALVLDATLGRPFLAVQPEAELPVWLAAGRYILQLDAPPSAPDQRLLEVGEADAPRRERFRLD